MNKIDSLTLVWDAKKGLGNDLLYIARKLAGIILAASLTRQI